MAVDSFSTWLSEKLLCINKDVDLDVFVEYISGILDTDTSREDKTESLEEIIGEIMVRASVYLSCLVTFVSDQKLVHVRPSIVLFGMSFSNVCLVPWQVVDVSLNSTQRACTDAGVKTSTTTYKTTRLLLHVLIYLQFRSGRLCNHTRYPGATKTYL